MSNTNFSNKLKEKILDLVRKNLVKKYYYRIKSKTKKIYTITGINKLKYGNAIIQLNNLILICEIIRCNKVVVPKKDGI